MAAPENYKKLGTVGTAYKGEYHPGQEYKYANTVYYEGSTYIALKDNPSTPPTADGVNWNYSARGGSGGGGAVDSVNGQTGVVELTAEDVKAVAVDGDTAENTVTFISNDTIDDDATSWTVVPKLESGIKHSTFAQRISQMFKNVRYLKNLLGTTDISKLGDGTVTGALDVLNSNLQGILLWENPTQSPANFMPQEIFFKSDDYDIMEIYFYHRRNVNLYINRYPKKNDIRLFSGDVGSNGVSICVRTINYVNDTTYSILESYIAHSSLSGFSTDNSYLIPMKIIGYKTMV